MFTTEPVQYHEDLTQAGGGGGALCGGAVCVGRLCEEGLSVEGCVTVCVCGGGGGHIASNENIKIAGSSLRIKCTNPDIIPKNIQRCLVSLTAWQ